MARDRIDRKELKAPDQFQVRTRTLLEWLQENRTQAIQIALAVATLVVVVASVSAYRVWRHERAQAALRAGLAALEAENTDEASTLLLDAGRSWSGTKSADLALLYAASALIELERFDVARVALEELEARTKDAILAQAAAYNLGVVGRGIGDADLARSGFRRAAESAGPYRVPAVVAMTADDETRAAIEEEWVDEAVRALPGDLQGYVEDRTSPI